MVPHTQGYWPLSAAIGGGGSRRFPRLRVPRERVLMGSSGFAFDDQAMIAHVTSPFTDKIAPYRSNPPTDLPTLSLSPSLSFFLSVPPPSPPPSFSFPLFASFLLPRHLSPGSRLVFAREHVADRAASREFNNCRSSRSRVNAMPRAHSFTSASIFLVYVHIHTGKGSSISPR